MATQASRRTTFWLQIICVLLGVMGLLAYATSKFSSSKTVVIITAIGILGCLGTLIALAFRVRRFGLIIGRIAGTLFVVIAGTYLILFHWSTSSRIVLQTGRMPSSSPGASPRLRPRR